MASMEDMRVSEKPKRKSTSNTKQRKVHVHEESSVNKENQAKPQAKPDKEAKKRDSGTKNETPFINKATKPQGKTEVPKKMKSDVSETASTENKKGSVEPSPTVSLVQQLAQSKHPPSNYTEAILKKMQSLKKRMDRISKYEHNPIESLNPDQKESLSTLPSLRYTYALLEKEILVSAAAFDKEHRLQERKKQKETIQQHQTHVHQVKLNSEAQFLKSFSTHVTLLKELSEMDPDDFIVIQLKKKLLTQTPKKILGFVEAVLRRSKTNISVTDSEDVAQPLGVTYDDVYKRLIEAPIHLEERVAATETVEKDVAVINVETVPTTNIPTAVTSGVSGDHPHFLSCTNSSLDEVETPSQLLLEEENPHHGSTGGGLFGMTKLCFMSGEDFVNYATSKSSIPMENTATNRLVEVHPPPPPPPPALTSSSSSTATSNTATTTSASISAVATSHSSQDSSMGAEVQSTTAHHSSVTSPPGEDHLNASVPSTSHPMLPQPPSVVPPDGRRVLGSGGPPIRDQYRYQNPTSNYPSSSTSQTYHRQSASYYSRQHPSTSSYHGSYPSVSPTSSRYHPSSSREPMSSSHFSKSNPTSGSYSSNRRSYQHQHHHHPQQPYPSLPPQRSYPPPPSASSHQQHHSRNGL